jgi:hypothetical protein
MNFDEIQKYPLCWPDSWPRAAYRISSRFEERTVNQAFEALGNELKRLGCSEWKLSTNIPSTSSGSINSTFRQPADPGVAAYFKYNKKPVALACDKWSRLEDNIYAIAKHIEALRGQYRWGVGTLEQAFRGYMALPGVGQTSGENWWQALNVPINATPERIKEAYLALAKLHHPDTGGDRESWERINRAYQMAEAMFNNGR